MCQQAPCFTKQVFPRSFSPARATQGAPYECCHWRRGQGPARTHRQPPFLTSCGTWQNCGALSWHQAGIPGCRERGGQMHTMDLPILSVPFCRRMMFTSKRLTLTFSETWAVTQQSSGTLRVPRHKVVVLWQFCHLAHTELMPGLWDTAQVFHVTPMKKTTQMLGQEGTEWCKHPCLLVCFSRRAAQISL